MSEKKGKPTDGKKATQYYIQGRHYRVDPNDEDNFEATYRIKPSEEEKFQKKTIIINESD